MDGRQHDEVRELPKRRGTNLQMVLKRGGIGMYVCDGHLLAVVAEVDVVGEQLRLVGIDELDQVLDGALQFLERPSRTSDVSM
jgi:hypothetical protein